MQLIIALSGPGSGHHQTNSECNLATPLLPPCQLRGHGGVLAKPAFPVQRKEVRLGRTNARSSLGFAKLSTICSEYIEDMHRHSLAAAAISAVLVGGSFWIAGTERDAEAENSARTSAANGLQRDGIIKTGDDGTSSTLIGEASFRSSLASGKVSRITPPPPSAGRFSDGTSQLDDVVPARVWRASSGSRSPQPQLPDTGRSSNGASSETSIRAPRQYSKPEHSTSDGLLQATSSEGGRSLPGSEPISTKAGNARPNGASDTADPGIGGRDYSATATESVGAVQTCFHMLVSPEVLSQVSAMSPEQIEAYTYLAGLLLTSNFAGGGVPGIMNRPASAELPHVASPEPESVSATGDIPFTGSRRGWTAFKFSDGGIGLIHNGDDATILEVQDGTVVGPYGRVAEIARAGSNFVVVFENGDRISGRADLLRFRDPSPRGGSTVPDTRHLGASFPQS